MDRPIWPLTTYEIRRAVLKALCALSEGAAVAASCGGGIAAVLSDPRVAAFAGRDGMPRSLSSIHACHIALYLGGIRGIQQPPDLCLANGMTNIANGMNDIVFGADGRTIVTTGERGDLRVVCAHSGHLLKRYTADRFRCVAVSSSTGLIFAGDWHDGSVHVFSPDAVPVRRFGVSHRKRKIRSAFAIAVGSTDLVAVVRVSKKPDEIFVYTANGAAVTHFQVQHRQVIEDLTFLADGQHVAVLSQGCVCVFTVPGAKQQRRRKLPRTEYYRSIRCSAVDELVVASTNRILILEPGTLAVMQTVAVRYCWHVATCRGVLYMTSNDKEVRMTVAVVA
jgi:hypothetical protein